jgi:hypothetical protein
VSADDLMFTIIIGGIGLTGAYLRAEFISWRSLNAAERRKKGGLHVPIPIRLPPTQSADVNATSGIRERDFNTSYDVTVATQPRDPSQT